VLYFQGEGNKGKGMERASNRNGGLPPRRGRTKVVQVLLMMMMMMMMMMVMMMMRQQKYLNTKWQSQT